jgi:hypothetical protein
MQFLDFLLVRKAQVQREIRAMGILYTLLLVLLIIPALVFFYKSQQSDNGAVYALIALTVLVGVVHYTRQDHNFINSVAVSPAVIYFAEYITLMFPLMLMSLLAGKSLLILLLPAVIAGISFWRPVSGKYTSSLFLQFLVKDTNFEWKSGIRKYGVMLVILWILSMTLVWVPFAPLVVLWFFLLTLSSFYDEGESREMLESYQSGSRKLLYRKIADQVSVFILVILPVLLAACLFFPERWWIMLLFLVFGSLNISVFIVSKYAVWSPGSVNRSTSIVNTLCMLGLFLPFLLPLPIFVFIRNYHKAVNNLNPVLHDYSK